MFSLFLNNIQPILYSVIGIVAVSMFLLYRHNLIEKGREDKEREILEANLDAVKNARKTQQTVHNLSDDELNKRMRDSLKD